MSRFMWGRSGRFTWIVLLVVLVAVLVESAQTSRRTKSNTAPSTSYNKKKCVETDYYCILEVSQTASEDEIKKQFRKLAKIYHPDKNRDNQEAAEQQFVLISKAYEILSDEKSRRDYDHERRFGGGGGGGAQRRGSFHSDENVDDIFRQFQSMFGEEMHGHRQHGHHGRNFHTRQQQQQQQQHFFHSQQQQQHHRPNQKIYFTQRGPDGRTYYYEYTTNNHQHSHHPFFGDDSDGFWNPFSFFFDQQPGHNRGDKPYVWYHDFIPTSIWARFVLQIMYYMFFLYLMLSIFSCCTGGAAAGQVGLDEEERDSTRRNPARDTDVDPDNANTNRKPNTAQPASNAKPVSRTNLDVIYPLPVISQKEINETRGIIFIVTASKEMELVLRPRRTTFSKDPLLFRRYHPSAIIAAENTETNPSNKRYEEVKLMERLFGGNWKDQGTANRLSSSGKPPSISEQSPSTRWKIVAVAKTGTKYAMFLPSVGVEKKLENIVKRPDPSDTDNAMNAQQRQQELQKLVEDLVGKEIDEWLCRLVQGMEPWLSSAVSTDE